MSKCLSILLMFFLVGCIGLNKTKKNPYTSKYFGITASDTLMLTNYYHWGKDWRKELFHILIKEDDSLKEMHGSCQNVKGFSVPENSQSLCFVELWGSKNTNNSTNQIALRLKKGLIKGKSYVVEFELGSPITDPIVLAEAREYYRTEYFVLTSASQFVKAEDVDSTTSSHVVIRAFNDVIEKNWSKIKVEFIATQVQEGHKWLVISAGNSLPVGGVPMLVGIPPDSLFVSENHVADISDTMLVDSIALKLKEISIVGSLFETNEFFVTPKIQEKLDILVELMKSEPSILIEIHGHTDNIGDSKENFELSKNRALAVQSYLIKSGIEENRLKVFWHGDIEPISSNNTDEGRAMNRRVEFKKMVTRQQLKNKN